MSKKTRKAEKHKHLAIIRFGGAFIFFEKKTKNGKKKTEILFSNSKALSIPTHDPILTFRELDLNRGQFLKRIPHRIQPGPDADALVSVNLYGDEQIRTRKPRHIKFLPDGVESSSPPKGSVAKLYDLSKSGVQALASRKSRYAARISLTGGRVSEARKVPGVWRVGGCGDPFRLMEGVEWQIPFDRYLTIRSSNPRGNRRSRIKLVPQGKGPLRVAFTNFENWHSDDQDPCYEILETLTDPKTPKPLPAKPTDCLRHPWPIAKGGQTPRIFCPNCRFTVKS